LGAKFCDSEIVCFNVFKVAPGLRIFVVYTTLHLRYSDDISVYNLRRLYECTDKFTVAHRVTIIVGDHNMSKINLLTLTSTNDKINRPFFDKLVEHGFCQFVNFPTHICNYILDIVLADDDRIINQVKLGSPLGKSGHVTVEFKIAINYFNSHQITYEGHYSWNIADYPSQQAYLDCYDWQSLIYYNPSAIEMWSTFTSVLHSAIGLFVPFIKPNTNNTVQSECRKRHHAAGRRIKSNKLKLMALT